MVCYAMVFAEPRYSVVLNNTISRNIKNLLNNAWPCLKNTSIFFDVLFKFLQIKTERSYQHSLQLHVTADRKQVVLQKSHWRSSSGNSSKASLSASVVPYTKYNITSFWNSPSAIKNTHIDIHTPWIAIFPP